MKILKKDYSDIDVSDYRLKINEKLKELNLSVKDNNFVNKWQ